MLNLFTSPRPFQVIFANAVHCKPKPCKAYKEHPVSQFSQGNTCSHYREPLFSLQGPCFHYRDFPVNPCTSMLKIAVCLCYLNLRRLFFPQFFLKALKYIMIQCRLYSKMGTFEGCMPLSPSVGGGVGVQPQKPVVLSYCCFTGI